jgi:hypothetical protein
VSSRLENKSRRRPGVVAAKIINFIGRSADYKGVPISLLPPPPPKKKFFYRLFFGFLVLIWGKITTKGFG